MFDNITDNTTQTTSKHLIHPNQLLGFTEVQSRRRGQGQHREDWPRGTEGEQRHALNIVKLKHEMKTQPAN